jgi:hypothetical protein
MDTFRVINSPDDITDDVVDVIETVFEGWWEDEPRIDWHSFIDRVEMMALVDFGSAMDSAAIKAIKKIVRNLKAAQ